MLIKYRASKITIEIPKPQSEPWVHIVINKMEVDEETNNVLNAYPQFEYISNPLSRVGTDILRFGDPVSQELVSISGYGIASALTAYVKQVVNDKYGEDALYASS